MQFSSAIVDLYLFYDWPGNIEIEPVWQVSVESLLLRWQLRPIDPSRTDNLSDVGKQCCTASRQGSINKIFITIV